MVDVTNQINKTGRYDNFKANEIEKISSKLLALPKNQCVPRINSLHLYVLACHSLVETTGKCDYLF